MAKAIFCLKMTEDVNGQRGCFESKVTKLLMSWRCSPRSFFSGKNPVRVGGSAYWYLESTKWRSKLE